MEKVPTWPSAGSGYCSLGTTLATDSTSVVIYCIITVKIVYGNIYHIPYTDITFAMFIVILYFQNCKQLEAGETTPLLKTADMNQNESAKGDRGKGLPSVKC